jgi:uncharacterized protein (TIGR02271 family)
MADTITTPKSTVVGVFDDYSTAEEVAQVIINAGVPREAVDVRSNSKTGAAGREERAETSEQSGVSGFFHRLFGGSYDADESSHYAEAVRRGSAVVSVTVPQTQVDQVTGIMNHAGAADIDRRVADYRETGYERHNPSAPAYTREEVLREREQYRGAAGGTAIPVVEEELQVGKRVVQRGGVRVYSHVIEEPVEESVRLREEHVRVERRPVDRPVNAADLARMKEQSVEVTETAEEPVVQKRARVREEVVVQKEATERTEQVRDKVRRMEVEVENLAGTRQGVPAATVGDSDYAGDFRRDYDANYARSGVTYDTLEPAYLYGYRTASDPRYRNRSWSDVEEDLRTDYMRQNPNSKWDQTKGAIRYGWEKLTGKR